MPDRITDRARRLRRDATKAERLLWRLLREAPLPHRARRQHPILGYFADFAFIGARLIVEVDGGQHAESGSDDARTRRLEGAGWRVIRFWNNDVLENPDGVLEEIRRALDTPSPQPSPPRGRGS
ncbi:MAG: DUF559 domain-containing protein [Zavarzinia sp.]|nr:DUF559 domain-containing protein [Zavarzinia sp.]